eukprot:3638225-Prymnesium_polylepis.1
MDARDFVAEHVDASAAGRRLGSLAAADGVPDARHERDLARLVGRHEAVRSQAVRSQDGEGGGRMRHISVHQWDARSQTLSSSADRASGASATAAPYAFRCGRPRASREEERELRGARGQGASAGADGPAGGGAPEPSCAREGRAAGKPAALLRGARTLRAVCASRADRQPPPV